MIKPFVAALLGLTVILPVRAYSQVESPPIKSSYLEWLTVNIGFGPPDDVHVGISYNFGWRHFFQVAVAHNEKFNLFGGRGRGETALNVAAGARASSKYAVASAFLGPAIIMSQYSEDDASRNPRFTAGLIVNPQFYLRPFVDLGTMGGFPIGGLGIGVDLIGSVNSIRSSFGVRLGLYLGTSR